MALQNQYGHTVFLQALEGATPAQALERVPFHKTAAGTPAHDERWLQQLIMQHPSLLPIDQIEPAITPLVPICEELPLKAGFLDNLLATPNGDLVLIECKLWRNPEARREVMGQIIHYASEMSSWNYQTLQKAIDVTKPLGPEKGSTRNLYELVSARSELDEATFVDAVSRNLRRGRFLLLIVGDGIREGVEMMAEFLQQFAGIRFTLALVELAVFRLPANGGFIAQPRVLAKTVTIGTTALTHGESPAITPSATSKMAPATTPTKTTISEEQYFERLEEHCPGVAPNLKAFFEEMRILNVNPEFGTDSLILRWRPEGGKSWNLGAIDSRGQVLMDWMGMQANTAGLLDQQKTYLQRLASLAGAVVKLTKSTGSYIAPNQESTSPIKIDALVSDQRRRDGWKEAIMDFQKIVAERSEPEN